MSGSTRRRGLVAAAAAVAFAATVIAAPPASARPIERGTFVDGFSMTDENFCDAGIVVEIEAVQEVRFLFNTRKPGTAPYWIANAWETIVYSNLEGDSVTEVTRLVDKDLKITDNGDGTLTILVLATGNTTVSDESGKAIARNPGQVRYELLIDYGDDVADPSDDAFLAFLGLVKESTGRTDDFCAAVLPVLG
ncbi:hypothetical protein GCM10017608_30920 [Agromyces luteolus]|uniref:Uncharacterized protein n=1 Tax=Agromyces luteolus TaxID=88373 RepID=A0A7C9HUX3_9MICO|nr:hypothetical protein [Agromyces luteolus]MUN07805.1 hypothetical protein [Agromyces luteolus]GLK29156.1 hypothetical protein GCM10017608_30920 [Agromyces luteolus]